jgi:hypothetical protein
MVETGYGAGFTPGTNVTSVTCVSSSCNSIRGTITIVGGSATTGTIATLTWTATPTAYVCSISQDGGATWFGLSNTLATTTGFSIISAVSVSGSSFSVNYSCQP